MKTKRPKSERLFRAFIAGNLVPIELDVKGPKVRFHVIPTDIIGRAIKVQMLSVVWDMIVGTRQSPCCELKYNATADCYVVAVTGEFITPIRPGDEPSINKVSVRTIGTRLARILGYPNPPTHSANRVYSFLNRVSERLEAAFEFSDAELKFTHTLKEIDRRYTC